MTPERWRRIVELFEAAVGWPEEARESRLRERCADDEELLTAVTRMLVADGISTPAASRLPSSGPLSSPATLGRYRLVERIGSGGFSEVYRAWDPELEREVAIKTSRSQRSDLRRRFEREAKIVGGLVHPNITLVHDFGVEGETAFLVQELLDGRDLRQVIDDESDVPMATRLAWLLDVARGLEHAHRHGVVHRDVKPSNLRICGDGRAKILDFGVAALLGEASRLTVAGSVIGTAAYMAPEQVRGDEVDTRADLYSFAAVAYELLAGEPVHRADSMPGLLYQILHARPRPLADRLPAGFPAPLVRLIERCLEVRPARRPDDLAPMIDALAAAETSPVATGSGARDGSGSAGRRIAWSAAAAAAMVVAGLVTASVWRGDEDAAGPVASGPAASDAAVATAPAAPARVARERSGTLVVDALPWAEVTAIHDSAGRRLAPPGSPYTPAVLALPPGEYTVTLSYPGAQPRRCSASVEPGGESRCSVRFITVSVDEYLTGPLPSVGTQGSSP